MADDPASDFLDALRVFAKALTLWRIALDTADPDAIAPGECPEMRGDLAHLAGQAAFAASSAWAAVDRLGPAGYGEDWSTLGTANGLFRTLLARCEIRIHPPVGYLLDTHEAADVPRDDDPVLVGLRKALAFAPVAPPAPPRADGPSADEMQLLEALGNRPKPRMNLIRLVEFMVGRDSATQDEIEVAVYGEDEASDEAIRKMGVRATEEAAALGLALRYRLAGGLMRKTES